MLNKLFLSIVFSLFPVLIAAQTCVSSISQTTVYQDRFDDDGLGTVKDKKTGLQWKQCSEGQTNNLSTCSGTPTRFNWKAGLQQANSSTYRSFSDWRLPNIKELRSIMEYQCYNPAVNRLAFPSTSGADTSSGASNANSYWSSTLAEQDVRKVMAMSFYDGSNFIESKSTSLPIILVRDP